MNRTTNPTYRRRRAEVLKPTPLYCALVAAPATRETGTHRNYVTKNQPRSSDSPELDARAGETPPNPVPDPGLARNEGDVFTGKVSAMTEQDIETGNVPQAPDGYYFEPVNTCTDDYPLGYYALYREASTPEPEDSKYPSDDQIVAAMPSVDPDTARQEAPYIREAMEEFGIDTPIRQAAFIGQCVVESARLTAYVEQAPDDVDPETYFNEAYAGVNGNDPDPEVGDGYRYRGRGGIQLTGKQRYQECGDAIGEDLVNNPDRAADPDLRWKVSAWYFSQNCMAAADAQQDANPRDWLAVSIAVNGKDDETGLPNGYDERVEASNAAADALGA